MTSVLRLIYFPTVNGSELPEEPSLYHKFGCSDCELRRVKDFLQTPFSFRPPNPSAKYLLALRLYLLCRGWRQLVNHPAMGARPTGAWLGFISAIQSVGGLVGMPLQAWCSNKFGRKSCIWVGYVFIIIGVAMQTAAPSPTLFIVSRVFVGHSGAWFQSAAILVTELAYPTHRSKLSALYQCIPRWLIRNDGREKAIKVLTKYHAGGDEASPLVALQMQEITDSIRQEDEMANNARWSQMLKTKGNRHRFHISVTIGIAAQWNGVGIVSYYLNLILNTVGFTSATQQTLINACLQVWNLIFAAVGSLLVDRAGRRLLFILSTIIMLVSYICLTGLAGSFDTTGVAAVGTAVIPFLFIYYAGSDLAYTPLLIAYPAETWTYSLRSKGVALTYMCTYLALIFNQFINPIAMDAIGWKYYIVYICLLVVILINVWLTYPETGGYSLEEMVVVFDEVEADGATATKASDMGVVSHLEDPHNTEKL
ncbi:uncharacterized protein CDV56_100665 [Aspergillus thermomutatus]|uniref:Major facilitator superfamily (MFS) profile domain-containing protein n=1 Tax=Aspergillus thermomutatus TaxID=41047 RepID=A0A397GGT0_ASPTH|nr:uncharacterized protein CDV56_100665 [Aspergillus thermomutatus]RHZ49034.1 hypothetical protein CDV56_100665 [Aspergillus thermomutatus]